MRTDVLSVLESFRSSKARLKCEQEECDAAQLRVLVGLLLAEVEDEDVTTRESATSLEPV